MIETSSLKENKYRETVKQQILKIRDTGLTNMFDLDTVQILALKSDMYELADFISDNPKEYAKFIITGDETLFSPK